MSPIEFLQGILTNDQTILSIEFTVNQLSSLVAAGAFAPRVIDWLRFTLYNIVARLETRFQNLPIKSNDIASSTFGKVLTYLVMGVYGILFTVSFDMFKTDTLVELGLSLVAAYRISQYIYKNLNYESSKERKIYATVIDKIGPKSEEIDTKEDQLKYDPTALG